MALTLSGSNGVAGVDGSAGTPALQGSDSNTGIAFGADTIIGSTGGSERFRCDSSGRLLVGATSARTDLMGAGAQLQVEGTTFATARLGVAINANNAEGGNIYLVKSRGTSAGGVTVVSSGDVLGDIEFGGADGTNIDTAARIRCEVDGTPGSNDMPGRLIFSTTADGASSPTERMRLTSNGYMRLGDGTTYYHTIRGGGGNEALEFTANAGQQAATTVSTIKFLSSDTGGAITERMRIGSAGNIFTLAGDDSIRLSTTWGAGLSYAYIRGRHSASSVGTGTETFIVWSNGNVQNTNNSYTAISDIKLKENIVDANSQWDDIKALRIRNYNLKEGQTHTQIGLIAQEVEPISPGLVAESHDRDDEGNDLGTTTKSVNYSVLYMKAVKALQEAMERIESLETRLAALEVT